MPRDDPKKQKKKKNPNQNQQAKQLPIQKKKNIYNWDNKSISEENKC